VAWWRPKKFPRRCRRGRLPARARIPRNNQPCNTVCSDRESTTRFVPKSEMLIRDQTLYAKLM
jgi:hypothetical protein